MPSAYKITSDPFFVNGNITETAVDTFTEVQISLPLDSLNQEGILVHAVYFSGDEPGAIPAATSQVRYQLTATSKTALTAVNDANVIAMQSKVVIGGAAEFSGPHLVDEIGSNLPYQLTDNLGLVATDNLFLAVKGSNQVATRSVAVRVVCSRVKLTSSAYAALVTNELSS